MRGFVIALLAVLALSGCADPTLSKDARTTPAPAPTTASEKAFDDALASARASQTPTPTQTAPRPADFALTVKVLTKQCFGEAGCNVTFRVIPSYSGPDLDADKTYDVLYRIVGDESGAQSSRMTLTGDEVEYPQEEYASTKSAKTKIRATVTEVLEQ